jgi:hypothetical protein
MKLFVFATARIEAKQPARGNIAPIEAIIKRMPERVLTNFAAVITDEFGFHDIPPYSEF